MANNKAVKVKRERIAACMTCPLCNKLLRNATTISECLHTFCRKCIYRKISDEEVDYCPICNIDLGCLPLEKLRSDHNLQDARAKIFPFKRRKVEAATSVVLPVRRKERSLSSLVVSAPKVSTQTTTGRRTKHVHRKAAALRGSRFLNEKRIKKKEYPVEHNLENATSPETVDKLWEQMYEEGLALEKLTDANFIQVYRLRQAQALSSAQQVNERLERANQRLDDKEAQLAAVNSRLTESLNESQSLRSELAQALKEAREALELKEEANRLKQEQERKAPEVELNFVNEKLVLSKELETSRNLATSLAEKLKVTLNEESSLRIQLEAEKSSSQLTLKQLTDATQRHKDKLSVLENRIKVLSDDKVKVEEEAKSSKGEASLLRGELEKKKLMHREEINDLLVQEAWRALRYKTKVVMTVKEKFPEADMQFWVDLEDDEEAPVFLDDSFPKPTPP